MNKKNLFEFDHEVLHTRTDLKLTQHISYIVHGLRELPVETLKVVFLVDPGHGVERRDDNLQPLVEIG